jgi:molybdate transport system substrate-binding protein
MKCLALRKVIITPLSLGCLILAAALARAGEIRVAVASNFAPALQDIAADFEVRSGHRVLLSSGATGRQYAQIVNGAPFEIFLAADAERPSRLEREGVAIAGSRFTYARGRAVLWSPRNNYVDADGQVLSRGDFRHLAIANPRLAPYGAAAREVLAARGLSELPAARIVIGENIGQTFRFVQSGAAELGFVAYSQILQPGIAVTGSYWIVPQSLYTPLDQQAVLLKDDAVAREFLDFLKREPARAIIRAYGYETP